MRPRASSVPQHRQVTVVAINDDAGTATVQDSFGAYRDVPLRFQHTRRPRVGETWVLDRSLGFDTFLLPTASEVVAASRYAETIGDGVATSIEVTHGFGTRDVTVQVYNATTYAAVPPNTVLRGLDSVTLGFGSAPGVNAYRVVIVG